MNFDIETGHQGAVMFCDTDGNIWRSDEQITYVVSEFGPYPGPNVNSFEMNWMNRIAR